MTEPALADPHAPVATPLDLARPPAARPASPTLPDDPTWWRSAVIYQVYVRSFADANGDGTGDLAGVRAHLPYLRDLGVDAIWFTPWYLSPLADGGYDVADYRAIDPAFGTLEEAEALIADALDHGIRTIIDVVPNHVSSRHAWFEAALAAGPGSPERERFWFRDGRGPNGDEPPTGWPSEFKGGQTWTRTTNPDGTPGQWYLHLFTAEQPDLNWDHPDVRAEHESILRFWFDRGAAGVRIDSAALLVKDPLDARGPGRPGAGRPPAPRPRRAPRHLPRLARHRRQLSRARACSSARSGSRTPSASPATSARTSCTRPSTSTSWPGPGTRPACATRSTRRSPRMPRSAPRRRGSCPTTTSPGPSPATAGRDSSFAFDAQALRDADRPRAGSPPRAGRGAAHRRAARLAVPVPGRRARARRGRGPPRRDPGPHARPLRRRRPGPRRLPRPDALEWRRRRRSGSARTTRPPGRGSASRPTGPT